MMKLSALVFGVTFIAACSGGTQSVSGVVGQTQLKHPDGRTLQQQINKQGAPRTTQEALNLASNLFPLSQRPTIIGDFAVLRDGSRLYSGTVRFVQQGSVAKGVVRAVLMSADGHIQIIAGSGGAYHLTVTPTTGQAISTVTVVPEHS